MLKEDSPQEEMSRLTRILSELKKEELIDMFVETLRVYGDYVEGLGKINLKYRKIFEVAKDFTKAPISPQLVGYIADKATPEMAGIFLKIMLKLNSISPQMNRLMDLSAKEKIQLGKDIKSVAEDFEKLKNGEVSC